MIFASKQQPMVTTNHLTKSCWMVNVTFSNRLWEQLAHMSAHVCLLFTLALPCLKPFNIKQTHNFTVSFYFPVFCLHDITERWLVQKSTVQTLFIQEGYGKIPFYRPIKSQPCHILLHWHVPCTWWTLTLVYIQPAPHSQLTVNTGNSRKQPPAQNNNAQLVCFFYICMTKKNNKCSEHTSMVDLRCWPVIKAHVMW